MADPSELVLNAALLAAPIRALLGNPQAEVTGWDAVQLSHQGDRYVYRVSGTARVGATDMAWSLVLKIIRPPGDPAALEPQCAVYWEREALVYRSGFLANLPGGLRAARCYSAEQHADGSHYLWLEALDQFHQPWSFERFGIAAAHFGHFNGAYCTTKPLPSAPWLGSRMLPDRLLDLDQGMKLVADPATWELPLIQRAFPVPVADQCLAIAERSKHWVDLLAKLPQTFCHLDTWRGNLFAAGDDETVAIDWALCGYAPPGQEIAALLWVTFLEFFLPVERVDALEELVLASYLAGLRAAGWDGDERAVRFAYLAHSLLLFATVPEALLFATDPDEMAWAMAQWDKPLDEIVVGSAAVTYALLKRVPEVERLFAELSYPAST